MSDNATTRTQKVLNRLILPRTKIDYTYTAAPEPEAWKWIILALVPASLLLLPSALLDIETIPAIADYPNELNSAIGLLLLLGSSSIMLGWWSKDQEKRTQAWRVTQEIRGLYFITGAFLSLALCGAPTVIRAVFTFFISLGCAMGSAARIYTLTLSMPPLEAKEAATDDPGN